MTTDGLICVAHIFRDTRAAKERADYAVDHRGFFVGINHSNLTSSYETDYIR